MKINARYAYGFALPSQHKPDVRPELAFAGRSNVGKSSLLNCLMGQKLARTSGTPGHTRLINLFLVNESFFFADLPGYGFARVSGEEKQRWQQLMEGYFQKAPGPLHTFLLLDIRHAPSPEDMQMITYLSRLGRPFTVLATKADKLSRSQTEKALQGLSVATGVIRPNILPVSAQNNQGREAVLAQIQAVLQKKTDVVETPT